MTRCSLRCQATGPDRLLLGLGDRPGGDDSGYGEEQTQADHDQADLIAAERQAVPAEREVSRPGLVDPAEMVTEAEAGQRQQYRRNSAPEVQPGLLVDGSQRADRVQRGPAWG